MLADINWQGQPTQGDVVGEPQRLLLRARSRDRQVPARQAVRQGELGERARRERPADPDAAAAPDSRHTRATRAAPTGIRRPSVRAPACSTSRRGKTTRRIFGGVPVIPAGRNFSAAATTVVSARCPARRGAGIGRRGPINNWTDAVGNGAVIAHRSARPASRSGSST